MDGAIVVNKPAGITSHDVVARVRRVCGERSVGHLGTLDPAATGVLPLLLGRLTRLARFFQDREKEYRGEVRFGFATDTYDADGLPVGAIHTHRVTADEVEQVLPMFRGRIQQQPPPVSAKKVGGVRAYTLARRQQPVKLSTVEVEVHELDLLGVEGDRALIRVVCSSGVYVRSLAHDMGVALGTAGHLCRLQRTRVGEFDLSSSRTLDALELATRNGDLSKELMPATQLLPEFPAVVAPVDAIAKILQGREVNLPEFSRAAMVRVFTPEERLIALGTRVAGSLFHPGVVFPL